MAPRASRRADERAEFRRYRRAQDRRGAPDFIVAAITMFGARWRLDRRLRRAVSGAAWTLHQGDCVEVVRADVEVISALYAAGACAANIAQDGKGYSSGTQLAEGSYFGRRAGRHAAARAAG